ncbi:MAG: DUF5615 family PIN-like protein [Candidatus Promineifilaceae bacterium]|nr:DUF5615 family PIN-like protein [Candidatus Promineifilaceae bacterium]
MRTDAPGSAEPDVLTRAQEENRILITFDKDFGELAFHSSLPAHCGVVLFRISMSSPEYVARVALPALEKQADWSGHFSVVEDKRIRMTPLPRPK